MKGLTMFKNSTDAAKSYHAKVAKVVKFGRMLRPMATILDKDSSEKSKVAARVKLGGQFCLSGEKSQVLKSSRDAANYCNTTRQMLQGIEKSQMVAIDVYDAFDSVCCDAKTLATIGKMESDMVTIIAWAKASVPIVTEKPAELKKAG